MGLAGPRSLLSNLGLAGPIDALSNLGLAYPKPTVCLVFMLLNLKTSVIKVLYIVVTMATQVKVKEKKEFRSEALHFGGQVTQVDIICSIIVV